MSPTIASMGPRPFSRGNTIRWMGYSLMRTRFNGATSFQPWKHAGGYSLLSWFWVPASMGPRPFSRGNLHDRRN